MRANTPGTARFIADPADISPFHDSLLYSDPRNKVPYSQISYIPAELTIIGGSGSGGGEGNTNPYDRFDVNDDGFVSPIDALILVNKVNSNGGGALGSGGGEGESSGERFYVDVNEDGFLSPLDILWVVNRINGSNAGGEGESPMQAAPAIEVSTSDPGTLVDIPLAAPSNWVSRPKTPAWVANSNVNTSDVDDLLAAYSAEEDQDQTVDGLVDDLFANGLI
jgi:hypothetical protein